MKTSKITLIAGISILATYLSIFSTSAQTSTIFLNETANTLYVPLGDTVSYHLSCLPEEDNGDIRLTNSLPDFVKYDSVNQLITCYGAESFISEISADFTISCGDSIAFVQLFLIPRITREESDYINTFSDYKPNHRSSEYFEIIHRPSVFKEHNYVERETWNVLVTGGTVVIADGLPVMALNNNPDIDTITFACDTLIVRDSIRFPGSHLNVFAKVIAFEDPDSSSNASFITTPVTLEYRARNAGIGDPKGEDGKDGLTGGSMMIFADCIVYPELDDKVRFIANGSSGQGPGLGYNGSDGYSMRDFGNGRVYYIRTWRVWDKWKNKTKTETYGARRWPGDGSDAVNSGIPGSGGTGGNIFSNHDLTGKMESSGGISGIPEDSLYYGGNSGTPVNSQWYIDLRSNPLDVRYHTSQSGTNAIAMYADSTVGVSGNFSFIESSNGWLNSSSARHVLQIGRRSYLNNNPAYCYKLFDPYVKKIRVYQSELRWATLERGEQLSLLATASEMEVMMLRINSNLNYFSQSYGSVSYLSFEFFLQNYLNEIDRALRSLYLIYVFENASQSLEARMATLEEIKGRQIEEITSKMEKYNQFNDQLPLLAIELASFKRAQDSLVIELEAFEQQLLIMARSTVKDRQEFDKIKQVAGDLALISSMIPGFQSVSLGLKGLSNFDFNEPISIDNLKHVYETYQNVSDAGHIYDNSLTNALEATNSAFDVISTFDWRDYIDNEDYRDSLNAIVGDAHESTKPLISAYEDISLKYQSARSSDGAIQAELSNLKAKSPEYGKLIDKVSAMQKARVGVLDRHNTIRSNILKQQQDVIQGMLAIDQINYSLSQGLSGFDFELRSFMADMKIRSQERLISYHNDLARAYEFRLVKQYPHELDLSSIYNRMEEFLEDGLEGDLDADSYGSLRGLYDNQLSEIINGIITDYDFTRRTYKVGYRLTSEQLKAFNYGKQIVLNPVNNGLLFDGAEDVRIIDIAVVRADYEDTGNGLSYSSTKLAIEHSGISRINKNGKSYLFHNFEHKHRWVSYIDGVTGSISHERPSEMDNSLLQAILSQNGQEVGDILFFSYPSANSDLVLSRDDLSSNGSAPEFGELVLEITYDFESRTVNETQIMVKSNVGKPIIYASLPDKNERSSGYASFQRFYHKNFEEEVQLKAPDFYGEYRFIGWTDEHGRVLDGVIVINDTARVSLSKDLTIQANYELWRSDLALSQDSLEFAGAGGVANFNILNLGTNPEMLWIIDDAPDWISITSESEGQGEAQVQLDFLPNYTGVVREAEIVVMNIDVINDSDTLIINQGIAYTAFFEDDTVFIDEGAGQVDIVILTTQNALQEWVVNVSDDLFSIEGNNTGKGQGSVLLDYKGNRSTEIRYSQLILNTGVDSDTLNIVQALDTATVRFRYDTLGISGLAGTVTIQIESDREDIIWKAVVDEESYKLTPSQDGIGSGEIIVEFEANRSINVRYASIFVEDELSLDSLILEQPMDTTSASFNLDSIEVSKYGGTVEVSVSTEGNEDLAYSIEVVAGDYQIIEGAHGRGNGEVSISFGSNRRMEPNKGLLVVNDGLCSDTLFFYQPIDSSKVRFGIDNLKLNSDSGSVVIPVFGDNPDLFWSVIVTGSFELQGAPSGFGSGEVVLIYGQNNSGIPAVGTLILSDDEIRDTLQIAQPFMAVYHPSFIEEEIMIDPFGGSLVIGISTGENPNLEWSIEVLSGSVEFLSTISGVGHGEILTEFESNRTGSIRYAQLAIFDNEVRDSIVLIQPYDSSTASISLDTLFLGFSEGQSEVSVNTTNGSNTPWNTTIFGEFSVEGATSGEGSSAINIRSEDNDSGELKYGQLIISDGIDIDRLTLIQNYNPIYGAFTADTVFLDSTSGLEKIIISTQDWELSTSIKLFGEGFFIDEIIEVDDSVIIVIEYFENLKRTSNIGEIMIIKGQVHDRITLLQEQSMTILSISDVDQSIKIYPNPGSEYFKLTGYLNGSKLVSILSSDGKVVYSALHEVSDLINISHLKTGYYIVSFIKDDKRVFIKLIKR